MKKLGIVIALLGASMLGDDCDGDVATDPTFRDWCGPSLCAWNLDEGKIAPAPTWNANDLGVSFTETPTRISQATTESAATCLLFTTVANVDSSAQMMVSVDFDSDGTFEYSAPIVSAQWQRVQMEITAPSTYQGITFAVTKAGVGTAILAEMRIQSTSGCSAPPVAIADLGFGEKCNDSSQCATGLTCAPSVTGSTDMLCAQCSPSVACPNGEACAARSVFLPLQCAPGAGEGASGAPCLANDDCASDACDGATPVPLESGDAGACDLDASIDASDIYASPPSNCQLFAARGGTCR